IESLDLPDIRLDAGILQLLDRLHHQLRPQLEAVRLLVALERAPSAQRAAAERTGCAASRAGSWFGGCIVARNATSAVTSAGLRFLPSAGRFPPPWRIGRTSWSRVRRVATSSSAGPRSPPRPPSAWQLRHCLLCTRTAPCSSRGERSRTYATGVGALLQASMCGDHGDESPSNVSVASVRKTSVTPRNDIERRNQLFAPQ